MTLYVAGLGLFVLGSIVLAVQFVVSLFPGFGNDPSDAALLPPSDYSFDPENDPWEGYE